MHYGSSAGLVNRTLKLRHRQRLGLHFTLFITSWNLLLSLLLSLLCSSSSSSSTPALSSSSLCSPSSYSSSSSSSSSFVSLTLG
ncbi:hypothetical protein F7725_021202 [Dissostichus mawsoni]|uniref:Uncharacterized protein n=1 Tax=Dissostichus mawsoni TaxID=36200 RepID=A0A7J5YFE5_DISMA|nr:hypothetical protein F7725_021202 [Dissostichus mawsoni]